MKQKVDCNRDQDISDMDSVVKDFKLVFMLRAVISSTLFELAHSDPIMICFV